MHEHVIPSHDGTMRHRVTLFSGEHYVTNGSIEIATLLGSCVAACLYDETARVAGMNHFLLANYRYALETPVCMTEAGRYGVHAMELLINALMKRGADRSRLRAKAFGGGAVLDTVEDAERKRDSFMAVGDVNCRFIIEFLRTERIPLVASDLGGLEGRVIHFDTNDHSVYMRRIKRSTTVRVERAEREYWKKSLDEHSGGTAPVVWT
ncbi:MAG: chemotaxis protein CheD [Spirochaetota bacterium]